MCQVFVLLVTSAIGSRTQSSHLYRSTAVIVLHIKSVRTTLSIVCGCRMTHRRFADGTINQVSSLFVGVV